VPKTEDYLIAAVDYCWTPPAGVNPALITAADATRRRLDPTVTLRFPFWTLGIVFGPGQQDRVGRDTAAWVPRRPHVAYLYAPGMKFWETLDQPLRSTWVMFRAEPDIGLEQLLPEGRGDIQFEDPGGRVAQRMLGMAELGWRERDASFWKAQGMLGDVLHLLLSAAPRGPGEYIVTGAEGALLRSDFAVRVQEWLKGQVHRKPSLPELADQLQLSVSGLCHRYKAEMGETVMRTHLRFRLQKVKQLLLAECTLAEAAERTGFSSAYHLSAAFKRAEGLSPRAYHERATARGMPAADM